MPELPEVEVTRLSFAERIRGARVTAVRVGKPLRWPLGVSPETLVGRRVGEVSPARQVPVARARSRRPADAPGHVGIAVVRRLRAGAPGPHDHFDLVTGARHACASPTRAASAPSSGRRRPTRRRRRSCSPASASSRSTQRFDGAHLHAALRRRRVAVKAALLGGEIVVGAGNIYACEALFEAGIDPRTRSDRISRPRADRARRCGAHRRWRARSSSAARPCATSAMRTARPARSSSRPRSMVAPASRAFAAARRSGASSRARGRRSSARAASGADAPEQRRRSVRSRPRQRPRATFPHVTTPPCERPGPACEQVFRHAWFVNSCATMIRAP